MAGWRGVLKKHIYNQPLVDKKKNRSTLRISPTCMLIVVPLRNASDKLNWLPFLIRGCVWQGLNYFVIQYLSFPFSGYIWNCRHAQYSNTNCQWGFCESCESTGIYQYSIYLLQIYPIFLGRHMWSHFTPSLCSEWKEIDFMILYDNYGCKIQQYRGLLKYITQ